MSKLVYIAHPVGGDVEGNVKSILNILRDEHTSEVIPVAPYLVALQYLNDHVPEERELGINANKEFLARTKVDEIWLCGPRISPGMKEEVLLGLQAGIPIVCHNPLLQKELGGIREEQIL